jgi:hypothetical protein
MVMKDKNPPNRIYCDTYLGDPMYSYTNHHDVNTRIEYIRADYIHDLMVQVKSTLYILDLLEPKNHGLTDKISSIIKKLEQE